MKCKAFVIFLGMAVLMLGFGGMVSYRLYAKVKFNVVETTPPSHDIWDVLLREYVKDGRVNYQLLHENKEQLNIYLARLQTHVPLAGWSREEQLAYWLNAYNAFTIKIILDNYPVESIKDIGDNVQIPLVNSTWDIPFIKIGGKELSLNDIEHRILREEFNEPTIHFAIVCASKSCPPLRNEAYFAHNIDKQLNEQALAFINDPKNNQIAADHIELSKVFLWYKGDFTKHGTLIAFLNKYSSTKVNTDAKIDYLDYDWSLNK
jgi:uncharacterized protein DUF547